MNVFANIVVNNSIDFNSSNSSISCSNFNKIKQIITLRKQKRYCLFINKKIKTESKRKIPKIINFETIIDKYPDDVFYNHFRMTRNTFEILYNKLKPTFKNCYVGRSKNYSLKYGLYMTIWKLANRNSFREISDRFGVAQGSAYRIFIKCVTLIANLKSKVIRFPRTATSQRKLIEEFEKIRCRPFPNTIGCIDGMHISISKPLKDPISFYNRKGFYSILVQGIVDSKMKFSDAFVGYPGSCHDAAMWNDSPIKKAITSGIISIPPENHLIGDGAYSLQMYMMTPFKDNGHLTEKETRYNTALSSTRVLVKQAFGILKKKWRMLHHLELHNLSLAKTIIMAAIVLHNIVIDHEGVDENDTSRINTENIICTTTSSFPNQEASNKRNIITNLICA